MSYHHDVRMLRRAFLSRALPGIAVLLAPLACDGPPALIAPLAPGQPQRSTVSVASSRVPRFEEEPSAEIAAEVPSFGGYYLDGKGHLVVYVANDQDRSRVINAIARRKAAQRLHIAKRDRGATVVIKKGQYTFKQLSEWRDSVYEHVLSAPGVRFDDLDEAINRVTIGLDRATFESARASVVKTLATLGVPLEAVNFQAADPVYETSARRRLMAPSTLLSFADTLAGGEEIEGIGACSLGIVADSASIRVLITASHCSSSIFFNDGTQFTQPFGGQVVGSESSDPGSNSTYCGIFNTNCVPARGSDADLIRLFPGIPSRRGAIARPQQRVTGTAGTLAVDQNWPWIFVSSTEYGHPVGTIVDKVGRTTGWTYGTIQNSCVDTRVSPHDGRPEYAVRCAIKTYTWAGPGDSGSPFFIWDGQDSAELMGFDFAGEAQGQGTVNYYAGYRALEADLGILDRGILKTTSDASVTPLVFTSDPDGLRWSGWRGGGNYQTTYTLSRTDYHVEYDRDTGNPMWVQDWSGQVYTTTAEQSYPRGGYGTDELCCTPDPYVYTLYSVQTLSVSSMGRTGFTMLFFAQ